LEAFKKFLVGNLVVSHANYQEAPTDNEFFKPHDKLSTPPLMLESQHLDHWSTEHAIISSSVSGKRANWRLAGA